MTGAIGLENGQQRIATLASLTLTRAGGLAPAGRGERGTLSYSRMPSDVSGRHCGHGSTLSASVRRASSRVMERVRFFPLQQSPTWT